MALCEISGYKFPPRMGVAEKCMTNMSVEFMTSTLLVLLGLLVLVLTYNSTQAAKQISSLSRRLREMESSLAPEETSAETRTPAKPNKPATRKLVQSRG